VAVGIGINVNHERLPTNYRADRHVAAIETGACNRASKSSRGCCGTSTPTTIVSLAKGRSDRGAFREVSSYASGKRVRIATPGETYTGTTKALNRTAFCA
jgi:hypothetical protein